MRFIDISEFEEVFNRLNPDTNFQNWIAEANQHLENIKALKPEDRGEYWAKHNHWKYLYRTPNVFKLMFYRKP
jgi:hypothetical protein